jgi:beta-lactamase regulating signal transducer with metallopeptidase domain
MHMLIDLSGLLFVLLAGHGVLVWLRHLRGWAQRRDLQVVVLAAPVVSLAVAMGGLHHFAGLACFRGAPPWDYVLGTALPLAMGLVALGGLLLGVVRLVLMHRVVARRGRPADLDVQALAARLAARLGVRSPRVLIVAFDRPLALTCGVLQPTVLLSTWMVAHLDCRELESVLAHELGHVARHDYLVAWLTTVLRDAFVYLPTTWIAYRQLQQEKELACDDLAIGATDRPLALASALAKVWHETLAGGATFGLAQPLAGTATRIEGRIERLLALPVPASPASRSRLVILGAGVGMVAVLLLLETIDITLMLGPMGCGPLSWLGRLF